MSQTVIKVENLGKLYRLGEVGTGTISHDLNRWWARVWGKEDPFAKIGQVNERTTKGSSDYVWALKDVAFEVKQGEVLGIIGRNGAGKSTLLKILSKVTAPTTGSIKVKGRIASLLEVGTGFHPELTGRENIYLNGAILGMTRNEIRSKFDEIVDFAGVERYIDTPVKRYSSGMYVRLAFAVAAFLEPEILIVDEVLAVGDAEFQKKCLGRMKDVSVNEGRTVLFVSHNMEAVSSLCNKGLLLIKGNEFEFGPLNKVLADYLKVNGNLITELNYEYSKAPGNSNAKLLGVSVRAENLLNGFVGITKQIEISIRYWDANKDNKNTAILHLKDMKGNILFASNEFINEKWEAYHSGRTQEVIATCKIPGNFLAEGTYTVLVAVGSYSPNIIHVLKEDIVSFTVVEEGSKTVKRGIQGDWPGLIRPALDWSINIVE